jgi:hypothetical protein
MALQNTPASTGGTRTRPSSITMVLLSLSFLWCLCWFIHSWGYWEDDAYIHLEFARSVAAGHGFTFNGKVVYGDTAPLWVFLLVIGIAGPGWLLADFDERWEETQPPARRSAIREPVSATMMRSASFAASQKRATCRVSFLDIAFGYRANCYFHSGFSFTK